MADRYWVGGSGTWDATSTANWSATSGGASGASVPTAADAVIVNSASTIALSGALTCLSLNTTGASCTFGGTGTLTVSGNITLSASTSWTATGAITVNATATVNTNNISLRGTLIINVPGGTVTLGSALTFASIPGNIITLVAGTFNTNNFNITATSLTWAQIAASGTLTKAITLGTSTLTLTSNNSTGISVWDMSAANTTVSAASSTINISLTNTASPFNGGGATYGTVSITLNGNQPSSVVTGTNTFTNLSLIAAASFPRGILIGANQTVTGTFTVTGTATNLRMAVYSNIPGTARTISAATTTFTNADFRDITAAGAGSWTAASLGNAGGNTGITFTAAKTVYWNNTASGSSWSSNSWAASSGGAVSAANYPLPQDTVVFSNTGTTNLMNINTIGGTFPFQYPAAITATGMTNTITLTSVLIGNPTFTNVNTITLASPTFNTRSTFTINGTGTSFPAAYTGTVTAAPINSTTQLGSTWSVNGVGITVNSTSATAGTFSLNGFNLTNTASTGTFTLTQGNLSLGANTLSYPLFSSNNSNTRQIQFGTGNITITGTAFSTATATNLTYTGTPTVNISNNSASATTVSAHAAGGTATNVFNFNFTVGSYALTLSIGSNVGNFVFSGGTISWTLGVPTNTTFYGDLTLLAGMTVSANSVPIFFSGTGTQVITLAGKTLGSITQNGVGGTVRFAAGTSTLGTLETYTLTNGTLDLGTNTATLSTGRFSSSNSNARAVQFGTGNITITGTSGSIWTTATATNLTYTGTPTVNISSGSGTANSVSAHTTGGTEANVFNFNYTGTTIVQIAAGSVMGSLTFTGYTGTWSQGASSYTFYRNLTLASGMTFTAASSGVLIFAATSGTQVLTSAGKTLGIFQKTGVGGTLQLAANTNSNASFFLSSGTLDLNDKTLSVGFFGSNNSFVRSIAFGTLGNISATSGTAGNMWNMADATNFTYTGTSSVTVTPLVNTQTMAFGSTAGATEANVLNFSINVNGGNFAITSPASFKSLSFNGSTSFSGGSTAITIYGDLTTSNGYVGGSATYTLAATSGTQTITSNGKTINEIIQDGVGGTVSLGDDYSGDAYTLTNGTFNANNRNFTLTSNTGRFASNNSNTRTITMGSGTWTLEGTGSVWDLATTTGLTFNKDTANIVLSSTTTNARTFAGGGLTYNDLTIGGATGISTLTFTGNNTFNTLASTKTVAHTIRLPAGGTTTVANWTIQGTSGNVVTLDSSTPGVQATLTKTTAFPTVNTSYMAIQDSNATPGSTWYAVSSTNNGNNTGWNITSNPYFNTSGFFFFL
jgi:hypothetical protein